MYIHYAIYGANKKDTDQNGLICVRVVNRFSNDDAHVRVWMGFTD